ncbi:MAG: ABC transporter permease [Alphaproteobacteria bacterium]|nr:ABC transporter permease [Alphaproteobacteria bacterium]
MRAPADTLSLGASLRDRPNAIRAMAVVLFFALWEYYGRSSNPLFMSYPSAIANAAWIVTLDGTLAKALIESLVPFGIGMAISIVGGIAWGVLMGRYWLFEYVTDPYVNALYAIPRVALVPLITLAAGLQIGGKVTIIASIAIFPIIINTYAGIKDVRGRMIEIGQAFGATDRQIFYKIMLPAAVPFIMAGIRLAVGVGIIGMVVAELFTAASGLGAMILRSANAMATDRLFVPILVLAVFGVVLTELVQVFERRLSKWRVLERERTNQ